MLYDPEVSHSSVTAPGLEHPRLAWPKETAVEEGKAELLHNLSNYIPLGTLTRLTSSYGRSYLHQLNWQESSDLWQAVHGDFASEEGDAARILADNQWIRVFSRRHQTNEDLATLRVYVLPDDVGRRFIERESPRLRNLLIRLVNELDISLGSWEGQNGSSDQAGHYTTTSSNNDSLFYLFNTLPSPPANPIAVSCRVSNEAMHSIIEFVNFPGLSTPLYPYQKRTVATMIRREVEPARALDPRFEQLKGPTKQTFYYDRTTGILLRDQISYEEARGGILGESMGLGKTMICLALIVATRGHWPEIPPEYSTELDLVRPKVGSLMQMAANVVGRSQVPWRTIFQDLARGGEDHANCAALLEENVGSYVIPPEATRRSKRPSRQPEGKTIVLSTATLVIVPQNLLSHWKSEISIHVEKDMLNVLYVDSTDEIALPAPDKLLQYDVILLSRQRFERDLLATERGDIKSPLENLHFLRIIMDEGHDFSSGRKTAAYLFLQKLHVDRKWIVSGTPANGLVGVEVGTAANETSDCVEKPTEMSSRHILEMRRRDCALSQEKKDLEKLGLIVAGFLQVKPWANSKNEDPASWQKYIMPYHDGRRKLGSFRTLLESLVVRHRIEDIEADIQLPPLYNRVVYLQPSWHDKLSINLFLLSLTANAVTSERVDKDYMFHSNNKRILNHLLDNLRQSGFYWYVFSYYLRLILLISCHETCLESRGSCSLLTNALGLSHHSFILSRMAILTLKSRIRTGFSPQDIAKTIEVSRLYLEEHAHPDSSCKNRDRVLLEQAIRVGELALKSASWQSIANLHEMGMFIEDFPEDALNSWSLVQRVEAGPLLIGATQLSQAQKWIDTHLWMSNPSRALNGIGNSIMQKLRQDAERESAKIHVTDVPTRYKEINGNRKSSQLKKEKKKHLIGAPASTREQMMSRAKADPSPQKTVKAALPSPSRDGPSTPKLIPTLKPALKSALKCSRPTEPVDPFPPDSPLVKSKLSGTTSAKLSYLLDRVTALQQGEKIIIFYDGDHVAYFIAQALDLINVRYLIYTRTLSLARQNAYITTFNTTVTFRVLLMNVHQAAHGLHVASASRVFFVNPVWQPNVEAQAIKRAHRIGQIRPVYVETLILKGTLEDQMLQRRKGMTAQEHQKAEKSLLDDDTMSTIIKNAQFIPLSENDTHDVSRQVARLSTPLQLFGLLGKGDQDMDDPDADLIFPMASPTSKEPARKRKSNSEYAPDLTESPLPGKRATNATPNAFSTANLSASLTADEPAPRAFSAYGNPSRARRVGFSLDDGSDERRSLFG